MTTLNLLVVDQPDTVIREDGFALVFDEDGVTPLRLTIAVVFPPTEGIFNIDSFLANLKRPKTERERLLFLDKETVHAAALDKEVKKKVVFVNLDMCDRWYPIETIGITNATSSIFTYDDVVEAEGFQQIRNGAEVFIGKYRYVNHVYQNKLHLRHENKKEQGNPARNLVPGLLTLFNHTCSRFMYKRSFPVLTKDRNGIHFGVHRRASFKCPLRSSLGFVNLTNLAHAVESESEGANNFRTQPFTFEKLRHLGVNM